MTSPDLMLMLLADARLPTAGHTQSAQLEPAVESGLAAGQVPDFIALRLATVTRVEAATAVVTLHHVRAGLPLDAVELAWAARTPSAAMRATSRAMGRALTRLVSRLWPQHPTIAALPRGTSRAVVLGAAADAAGLDACALARLVGYDDVQTVAAAALKLLPLDPAEVAAWVLAALPAVDRLAADVAHLTTPAGIPAAGAPRIEAWAQAHAATTRRLFSA
ncbi:urease accessory UreF family protein [Aeromicrobium duanguangcaii]|uniref:Urease accessory protein UreF n=1 Tax=Aeromicrobium duanguangcaii TaxID=2968086 RepID=A0ABY5KCH3_9ACTN|nr:urease accessory UreF family protein [Aeromicrobium duanguangcaii]MCD9154866.1 urease accessory protein UreF [Aeromicrobium duanguangcaii]MCL3839094.1 urease accessory protein UreF [Aeromicrobium duanguangcaii]UUI67723.1 urease accessory protein UreF [Aeromicrobium duanguangcaii]